MTPPPPYHHQLHTSSLLPNTTTEAGGCNIIAVTFRAEWNDDLDNLDIINYTLSFHQLWNQ